MIATDVRVVIRVLVVAIVAVGLVPEVWAHGDPPEGQEIYVVDGDQWVYATNFGIIDSHHPHQYVCEEAFGASSDYHVVPLADDHWVTISETHTYTTADGCEFEYVTRQDVWPVDVAYHSDSREVAYVEREAETRLQYSDDGGESFSVVGADVDEMVPSGIGFIDEGRLVFVGYDGADDRRGEAFVAEIDVETGDETVTDIDDELRYPELLDVRDGQMLWFASRDDAPRLLWYRGDDYPGKEWEVDGWPRSGAIGPEGQKVYFGHPGVVQKVEDDETGPDEVVDGPRAQCMAVTDDGELLVCGHREDDGYDLARYDGQDLESVHDFRELQGYRDDCDGESRTIRNCPAVWEELAPALDIDPSETSDDVDDGGCTSLGAGGGSWWTAVVAALALAGLVGRREVFGADIDVETGGQ